MSPVRQLACAALVSAGALSLGAADEETCPKEGQSWTIHRFRREFCGEEPWEWKCRSEENRLLISSCVALGHDKAWFVSCPFADHGRAFTAGVPYVEMFVQGRIPPALKVK